MNLEYAINNCYYCEDLLDECFTAELSIGFTLIAIKEIRISYFEWRVSMSNIVDLLVLRKFINFLRDIEWITEGIT